MAEVAQWGAFLLVALSPVGGMVVAIPLGVLAFGFPPLVAAGLGVAAAWAQAALVDVAWSGLEHYGWWRRLLERQRRSSVVRCLTAPRAFWPTVLLTPLVGPWAVMGLMRYAGVTGRQVTPPILLGLALLAGGLCGACEWAPALFSEPPQP